MLKLLFREEAAVSFKENAVFETEFALNRYLGEIIAVVDSIFSFLTFIKALCEGLSEVFYLLHSLLVLLFELD